MKYKRKDVTIVRKLEFLTMALREREIRPDTKWRTDVIGIACQFSNNPKLKREDFDEILDIKLKDFDLNKF